MKADVLLSKDEKTEKILPKRVCFVCTGNTCRSPMAAAVYNFLHEKEGAAAFSAGTAAAWGQPIHPNAAQALRLSGIPCTAANNYEAHFSHPLSEADMESADLVMALTPAHAMQILGRFPEYASKVAVLGDISDPFGGDTDDYLAALTAIKEALS